MSSNRTDMRGRTCVVTGASSGIGRAAADELAGRGAHVVMVCRDRSRGEAALGEIRQRTGSRGLLLLIADLSSQQAIWRLAQEIESRYPRIDVLINNAGALFPRRTESADGLEMTFALNHMGYYLLTNLLLDTLKRSAPSRIINVTSRAHRRGRLEFGDLQKVNGYREWRAYADSKLANILFTTELSRQLAGSGVTVNSVRPGLVGTRFAAAGSLPTRMIMGALRPFMLKPEEGAATVIHLACDPEVAEISGQLFYRKRVEIPSRAARDEEAAGHLWRLSAELTGVGV
jgi:retinol dehydrogenase 12